MDAGREAFVTEAYAGLYRWFHRLTGSPEWASDLTQETFTAFWASETRRKLDVSPITWLYAIGRNQWRKRLRDHRAHESEALAEPVAGGRTAEERAQDREFQDAARDALARLPHDLREAFTLRFWNEFSYQEIGQIQGIDPGLARWRYFTARRRLHRELAAWDPSRELSGGDAHGRVRES
ncbi:MAG: sigma-70 family RNA polymerase sigma factor [Isosphaeraceae bacterium]